MDYSQACIVILVNEDGTETVLTCNENHEYTANLVEGDELVIVLRGDANLDGRITTSDSTAVLRALADLFTPAKYANYAMDANKDGRITTSDATSVLRSLADLFTTQW